MATWNWLDWILAAIVVGSVVAAMMKGFVQELISLASVVVGLMVAAIGYPRAALWFDDLTKSHEIALGLGFLVLFLGTLVVGALKFDWYITEIGALFLGMGILAGIVGRLSMKEFSDSFVSGAKDMLAAALVVACSRGILVIATEGKIIDTILDAMTGLVRQAHPVISAYAMLVVQFTLHFLVPSGSGQAALSMPIMTPLADLLGITRQTAVLVFQYGDGFNSLILPTSGVTMGVLAIAKIPYEKWLKWVIPLQVILYGVGMIFIAIAVMIKWGPL
jgi:uncharacterized ion transporter superfamily protein YfcC